MMKNPPHPGELVGDILAELGVSLDEAADALGISSRDLRDVITGRTAISAEMAVRLEKALGSTAGAWLRMQDNYDLAHIEASSIEVRRLRA
jgi:addiction module HigA family antidote